MKSTAEPIVKHRVALKPHPSDAPGPVRAIEAEVCSTSTGELELTYRISGNLDAVRVPRPAQPRIVHGLWEHTCCEVFLRTRGADAYHELNLSPSGEWAVYAFEHYREGRLSGDDTLDPRVRSSRGAGMIEVRAAIDLSRLCFRYVEAPLALGLSTVVEAGDGTRTYWALKHPSAKPDFHHRDAFALEIDAVRN